MKTGSAAGVSVVVPCFRAAATVERAVESLLAQTRPAGQILLVDDASGDGTLELLRSLAGRAPDRIEVVALDRNQGVAAARNAGWERAREDYVAFLDADDVWPSWKLELQQGFMLAHPAAALSGGATMIAPADRTEGPAPPDRRARRLTLGAMLVANRLATSTVMVRRNLGLRFAAGKRYSEDYLLWLETIARGHEAYLLTLPLAYRFEAGFGGRGLSGDLWAMWRGERDAYARIRSEGLISGPAFTATQACSGLRFLRRAVLSCARSRS